MALSFTVYNCSDRSVKQHFLRLESSYNLCAVVTSTNHLHCATDDAAETNST
jgi:hypothetical protein